MIPTLGVVTELLSLLICTGAVWACSCVLSVEKMSIGSGDTTDYATKIRLHTQLLFPIYAEQSRCSQATILDKDTHIYTRQASRKDVGHFFLTLRLALLALLRSDMRRLH
jgi:hypothetical protein